MIDRRAHFQYAVNLHVRLVYISPLQKNAAQNLHNKDLISQNLDSMRLTGRFLSGGVPVAIAMRTSFAGTILE